MKIIKRVAAVVMALGVCSTGLSCFSFRSVEAADVVSISPFDTYEINNGVFEGWGTSLCWWANRVGYSDVLAEKTGEAFFGDTGLRMNIARFNIGGGDDPTHDHITRTDSNMPGYSRLENGRVVYDWNADYNQRNVLFKALKASGNNLIVEMFSNSPPYYMTESGCSSGNRDAGKNNLKNEWYGGFADYMAEVCAHYQNEWGVDVQSVEPFNEPYTNFWGAYSAKQEGCHFDIGASESNMIMEMQRAMKAKNMSDVIIAGTDETSIDTQIDAFNTLSSNAKNAVGRIDTHTYGGSKRTQLKDLAKANGKNLWMSEVDGAGVSGVNAGEMGPALWLANRINADCNGLNSSAWIIWQAIDKHISKDGYNGKKDSGMPDITKGFWGLAVADHDNQSIILTKKYYVFGQFSRYIRPGYTMLKSSGSTMAAYDKTGNRLVIVATNDGDAKKVDFDLSEFTELGNSVQVIRTSGNMQNGENWKELNDISTNGTGFSAELAARSVTTYIIDDVKAQAEIKGEKINITPDRVTGSNPWNNTENDCKKAFDGNTSSFFDGVGDGWVQADLGDVYDITAIGYAPRSGYEYRCKDAYFTGSADGVNWERIYTISSKPASGMRYATKLTANKGIRYIRYQVPSGAPADSSVNKDSVYCCNIAEIEVYGTAPEKPEGDVNGDGSVTSVDLADLVKYLLGMDISISAENSDIDKNGRVDVIDFILLKSILA